MPPRQIILWTGPKHSGKTNAAGEMVKCLRAEGCNIVGILAPSLYEDHRLVGFDVVDIATGRRAPLFRAGKPADAGRFAFCNEGVHLGRAALNNALGRGAELIIVDEFGPLELSGRGWRNTVDELIESADCPVLLVVREKLCSAAADLYTPRPILTLPAADTASTEQILHSIKTCNE